MADTKVTIDVDLNTSPAAQGLRDLQRQYNAFTSSLNRNNAAQATAARQYSDQLLRLVNSSQMFTAETVRMQTAAGRLDKTLAKGQVTMGQFFSARFIRDSTAAAQVLSLANARAAALQTQFFATSAAANGMRDAIAVRPYEAFNSALAVSAQKLAIHRAMLMQATTHMINFGKNTQWAGRQLMVGFTVPLTIFGGVAGKVFRELEEEVINFKKVYGDIFTTEEETGKALAAVQELSKEFTKYGIAVKDTMALANVAAQSGLRNAELMAATTQATRLATLGQMEQAEAMKTIISLQTAFKSSNEELAESVDFLNIIENQTVLALQDVASAIPRVAPVIQGLGGDVKDLAVLLVAMKEGGVTAGEGANALKSSLGRLIVPTKAAKEMAAEFGISLEQIVENNRGQLLPMIMELGQALEGVDSLGRQQLLSTIFGKFQYARIGALFDNITRDSSQAARAMELMNLSAAELGQIAEKELKTVEESVGARFTAAMEKAKLAIAPLGEAFLNLSIPLINMFTKIIEKFNELPDFAKKFAVFGSVIVGVVIPVGTMFLGLLMNLIGTLIKFGGVIGIAFKGFTSGGIKGAIQAVSQALNYMSLEEIDAANAAQQLGQSTQVVNEALRQQVPRTAEAALGINQLGAAYASLILRMREAAALSATQGGAFVVPGAAADLARKGPRPRGYNKGGKVLKFNDGNTVPGVGNTDTVPAMLTPGEFVVNKQATKDNLETLQAINNGDVQYRNKGGGIATPGRMFYGRIPSAEDFVAMARKGINPLDDLATAQARETGIGGLSVSLPRTAPSQARAQAAIRTIEEIIEPAKRGAYRILQRIGVAPRLDTRGSVGYHTRYNQQMKDENKGVAASLLRLDLKDSRYDSFAVLRRQTDEWNRLNPTDKVDPDEVIKKFIDSLDNLGDTVIKDAQSQQLYRNAIGNKRFLNEIDKPFVQDAKYSVPAAVSGLKNNGYVEKSLSPVRGQKVKVKVDDERGSSTFGEIVVLRIKGKKKDPVTGKYIDDIISKERLVDSQYMPKPNEFIKDQSGKSNIWVNDPVEGLVNLRGLQGEVGRAGSINPALGYKNVETPKVDGIDIQFAHANKGGLIQYRNDGGEIFESGGRTIVPGVGNTDTVPAMLTPGEFVVNKQATMENKPLLQAINNGVPLNMGGRVPGVQFFAEGNSVRAAKLPPGQSPTKIISGQWRDVEPGKVLGLDKNGKPITNPATADGLLKQGKLFGWDGKPITQVLKPNPEAVKALTDLLDDEKQAKKFTMTRAQKIWAVISALTMGATAAGIATYERNKRDADPLAGYNKGGRVPAMLTPGEFIVDRDKAQQNLGLLHAINNGEKIPGYAIGGLVAGAAQLALPLGLSLAAAPVGAKAGEAVGGDTGAMIGGMAASFLPFMLPWGKIFGRGKGAAAAAAGDPNIRKTTTIAGAGASQVGAASTTTAKSMLASSVQFLKLARIVPLLFNPFTAIAAAAVGVAYTLAKMQKSNQEEYRRGQAYADAMTTSAEDIKALGTSARDRARNMDQWLNQSESQFIQEEYAGKIAKAKTKAEKKLLEIERDRAVQERGTMTRREAFEDFYRKDIANAKKRGASEEEITRLYEQRNTALGVQGGTRADFGFDKTFGTEFIKGAGEKDFRQFQMTRDLANQFNIGQVSSAQLETLRRVSDAAYGFTTSVEQVAELDMASKLAQYVLSGTMTQDQAASIAEAIGAELGDLRIGTNIRDELTGIVGAEGQFAKNRPGQVALQLAEQNERRTKELQEITKRNVSYLLAQRDEDQIQARTKRAQQFDTGAPAGFNLFTQFFSGMADEARRNVGGLIELQSSEFQMLEENIAAVGLAYNDLIAQAKTLAEADRYRYERARSIEKLQERRDELQQERQDMLFGSEENRQRLMKIGMDRLNRVRNAEIKTERERDRFGEIDPLMANNFFTNIIERTAQGLRLVQSNVENFFDRFTVGIQGAVETAMPSSFAQIMTTQLMDASVKKYEGSATGAAINTLIESIIPTNMANNPILGEFWMRILDDEAYASTIPMFLAGLASQVEEEAQRGEISNAVAEGIKQQVEDLLMFSPDLAADLQMRMVEILSSLDTSQMGELTALFDMAGDPERTIDLYERFIPLLTKMGQLVGTKLPSLGDKTIISSIFGDQDVLKELSTNDEAMLTLMEFFDTLASIDDDLELRFLEQFKDIPSMIDFMDGVEKIKFKDIIKNIRDARKAFKELSDVDMTPEKAEEFDKYMFNLIERLNNVEDPEIKARLTAEIAPEVLMMQQILQDLPNLQGAELQAAIDTYDDFVQSINARVDTATAEAGEGKKKPSGGGGSKEDPLNDLFRQLRDTADLLSDIGTELLSVNRESKSIFDKLREQNVNETVIAYLRSMGPEQAIKVGQEVLGNNKKLNTLMQLVGESEIARQQDAARVAQERNKFVRDMMGTGFDANGFRALSGAPLLDMEAALNDEEFIAGMMAARGTATPNKSMRMFQQSYFAEQQAQRRASSSMAPTIVQSQIQQNLAQTYAANELRNRGLSQEEIETALQSDAIMNRIRTRLEQQKSIGPVITKMAKDLYASTKTIMSILDEGISKVGNVFDFLSESLDNATQQIDKFTIKPLQDDLEEIQKSNSEMAETQRRLSRSLTLLQKTEADTRERQKEDEEKINESYDLRIEALEKVDKINKDIEDRQKGQISVADALSRGDIGAAARAAQEMQAKAAQARREEAIQAMRDQKEEDMQSLKEAHEQELENLTISVNGELLTREQIQERIDDLETKIYDNSLKEYDIQQKINSALEERRKIEEQIERVGIARQAIAQLQTLNQTTDEGTRRQTIASTQQTLQLLGGPESERLIQLISQNMSGLLSTDEPTFGAAIQEVLGGFGPLMSTLGTDIGSLNIQIPNIQTALNNAIATVNTELPNIFSGISTQIDNLNKSINVDPESEDNPFAKVYKAAKKVAKQIEKAFANIKPPAGSGGGGGGEPDEPPTGPKPGKSDELGPAVLDYDELPIEERRALRSKTNTQTLADGRRVRITQYYDSLGRVQDELTSYQVIVKKGGDGRRDNEYIYETDKQSVVKMGGFNPFALPMTIGATGSGIEERRGRELQAQSNKRILAQLYGGQLMPGDWKTLWQPHRQSRDIPSQNAYNQARIAAQLAAPQIDEGTTYQTKMGEMTGKQIFDGIVEGIKQGAIDLSKYPDVQTATEDYLKDQYDIGSPAKKMFPIGGSVALGILKGTAMAILNAPVEILNKFISGIKKLFGINEESGSNNPQVTGVGKSLSSGILNALKIAIVNTPFGIIANFISGLLTTFGIVEGDPAGAKNSRVLGVGTSLAGGMFSGLLSALTKSPVGLLFTVVKTIAGALGISVGEDGSPGEKSNNSGILGIGKGIVGGMFQGLLNWFKGTSVGKFIEDLLNEVQTMLENAFSKKSFLERMYEIGKGIWNAVKSGVLGAISGLGGALANAAKEALGLNNGGEVQKRAFGGMISYKGSREPAPGMMMGGKVKKYAIGGFVPGRGMTDKVPALLTPGEFVVRKSVAQQMMPALKDMNSQVFPGMGVPQKRSLSVSSPQFDAVRNMSSDSVRFGVPQNINSYVYPSTNMSINQTNMESNPITNAVGPTNVQYNYNLKVTARTNASADEIANTVMYKIKRFDDRRIKGTEIG